MSFDRDQAKPLLAALADKGVFVGTSSWKYEGWFGQLYTPSRYEYRGRVAKTRFERGCLTDYAEVFKTVCVDAAPAPSFISTPMKFLTLADWTGMVETELFVAT